MGECPYVVQSDEGTSFCSLAERQIDYARQLAHLRTAAAALLHHDTPQNRADLWRLIHPDQWAAECDDFGCHDDHSSRYRRATDGG